MFSRIVSSSKVQTTFISLVGAVLLAGADGKLDEGQVRQIIDLFLTYVLPTLLVSIGVEDAAKKLGLKEEPTKSPPASGKWEQL